MQQCFLTLAPSSAHSAHGHATHARDHAEHASKAHTRNANNREVYLCLRRLPTIIAKHRNITQKLLGTMVRQLNTTRAGITRKRRIMLTLPTVTPHTLVITLSTQARLIRRSTAKSSGRRFRRQAYIRTPM